MRKEFNSHMIFLIHQHDRFFFVLEHQHGHRDIMWKWSIDGLTKEIILSFWTLSYGDNSKAAVIRIGLKEMIQFAQRFYENVELETFFVLFGVADLILTVCWLKYEKAIRRTVA